MALHKRKHSYDDELRECKGYPIEKPCQHGTWFHKDDFTERKGLCHDCYAAKSRDYYKTKVKPNREKGSQGFLRLLSAL